MGYSVGLDLPVTTTPTTAPPPSRFLSFERPAWAKLRDTTPLTLSEQDLGALRDPTVVLSAFGDAATEWAAVVEVSGLDGVAPLHVVLGPYGDEWLVVGVTAA